MRFLACAMTVWTDSSFPPPAPHVLWVLEMCGEAGHWLASRLTDIFCHAPFVSPSSASLALKWQGPPTCLHKLSGRHTPWVSSQLGGHQNAIPSALGGWRVCNEFPQQLLTAPIQASSACTEFCIVYGCQHRIPRLHGLALVHHMLRVWHWTCQQTEQGLEKLVHRLHRRADGRIAMQTIAVCCVEKGDASSDGKIEDLLQLCIHALLIPPEHAHGVCTTEHTCT